MATLIMRPALRVGEFTLKESRNGPDLVEIMHESGEGGDFPAADLARAIADYYREAF